MNQHPGYVTIDHVDECPDVSKHTKCPSSYTAWHEWARKKARRHIVLRCPTCNRFAIWIRRQKDEPDYGGKLYEFGIGSSHIKHDSGWGYGFVPNHTCEQHLCWFPVFGPDEKQQAIDECVKELSHHELPLFVQEWKRDASADQVKVGKPQLLEETLMVHFKNVGRNNAEFSAEISEVCHEELLPLVRPHVMSRAIEFATYPPDNNTGVIIVGDFRHVGEFRLERTMKLSGATQ